MSLDNNNPQAQTVVVCLVLQDVSGAVLATQRPEHKRLGLLWEFPGGKVEFGEDPKSALKREIDEELHLRIDRLEPLPFVDHQYDFGAIRLLPFLSVCQERPVLKLAEHVAARWISPTDWQTLGWAPADIPVIQYLLDRVRRR